MIDIADQPEEQIRETLRLLTVLRQAIDDEWGRPGHPWHEHAARLHTALDELSTHVLSLDLPGRGIDDGRWDTPDPDEVLGPEVADPEEEAE